MLDDSRRLRRMRAYVVPRPRSYRADDHLVAAGSEGRRAGSGIAVRHPDALHKGLIARCQGPSLAFRE